ncbi:MAG TPA: tetratricopeptide repeat protein, partial [Burkholderiaceae bacterium]
PLQKAADLLPADAMAQFNCGVALHDNRNLEAAIAYYNRALAIDSGNFKAHNNLGNILKERRDFDAARIQYRIAISIEPNFAEAHHNLALASEAAGDINSALQSYQEAVKLRNNYANAWNNFGNLLRRMARLSEAEIAYRNAISSRDDNFEAYNNLGMVLHEIGDSEAAEAHFLKSVELNPCFLRAHSNLLLSFNYSSASDEKKLAAARDYNVLLKAQVQPYRTWRVNIAANRPLKIGFVSGDLRTHPVGFFLENILRTLRTLPTLELIAYSNNDRDDDLTGRLRKHFHTWHNVADVPVSSIAAQIHSASVDILLDLSGHTAHNLLPVFAWKPAPIQASWLGYVATTGLEAMDYFIADNFSAPKAMESQFVEKVWCMPESMICFTPPEYDLPVSPPPSTTNGFITFGSFNNLTKMNDSVVSLWSQVLHRVTNSRIFLNTKQLNDAAIREATWSRFEGNGIKRERVILEYVTPRVNSLRAYSRIDIALDPFPYNGGTTTAEALWMGVPVLTLAGDRLAGRMGVSQLSNVGLSDWIAKDHADYLAKAKAFSDVSILAKLRERMRRQVLASPLFDSPRFAGNFHAALQEMWVNWCRANDG